MPDDDARAKLISATPHGFKPCVNCYDRLSLAGKGLLIPCASLGGCLMLRPVTVILKISRKKAASRHS